MSDNCFCGSKSDFHPKTLKYNSLRPQLYLLLSQPWHRCKHNSNESALHMGQHIHSDRLLLFSTALLDGVGKGNNLIEVPAAIRDEGLNEGGTTVYAEVEGRRRASG